MDFERTTTVGASADAVFDLLADPARLADWVPTLTHVETEVEEGSEAVPEGGPAPRFLADRATRRIEWGDPDGPYGGSVAVRQATASLSDVTIRLRVRDGADADQVKALVEQAARAIGRLAVRR